MIQYDESWELEDENIPPDQHTVQILTNMVNTIRLGIQMEGDWGSKYPDNAIPVLDLKLDTVLVHEVVQGEDVSYYQVSFKFYKKPVSRPTIINASTAMAAKIKRETTSNELLRRLLNTSRGLPNSDKDMLAAVNQFMVEMRDSGYDERYRRDTVTNTVKGYRRKVEESENGGRPLYREGHDGARERHMSKIRAPTGSRRRTVQRPR